MYQGVRHFRYMLEGRRCHIVTDHKPLTFAFHQKMERAAPRQARQLDFVSQFTTDIRHIAGAANVTADLLSRIESIETPVNVAHKHFLFKMSRTKKKKKTNSRLQLFVYLFCADCTLAPNGYDNSSQQATIEILLWQRQQRF